MSGQDKYPIRVHVENIGGGWWVEDHAGPSQALARAEHLVREVEFNLRPLRERAIPREAAEEIVARCARVELLMAKLLIAAAVECAITHQARG